MSINLANNNPRIEYSVAAGVTQTVFAVPFEFFDDADITVYVDGVLKSEGEDYTVTGGDGSTGTVTFVTAEPGETQQVTGIAGGSTVVLVRDIPLERASDFSPGVEINRAALNEQLDILTAMVADAKDRTDRTIRLNPHEVAASLTLPSLASRKGKVLAFDETTGDVINGPTTDAIANAQTNATNAAASASAAASSASSAASSASAAASSASAAASSESHAASSEAAADAAEAAAIVAKDAAESAATTAQGAATSATSSANAASSSASSAASSASSASSSASSAASSASAAEAARDATLAAYDNFDDRYLGTKTSDPTLDNDGNALVAGALYFNSVDGAMKVYTGSAWVLAYISGGNYLDTAGGVMTGDIDFGDNVKATFGTSEDMWIYHDGGSSYIYDRGTGNLRIITNSTVSIDGASGGEFMAQFVSNGAVTLYYDNGSRLATTTDGVDIFGTGSLRLPNGTTLQRPASPSGGDIRFNTDLGKLEGYSGSAWGSVGGGATGGGSDEIFIENGQTVTQDYTIPATRNAMSTGPVTVNSGVTVTVSSGARYVVI